MIKVSSLLAWIFLLWWCYAFFILTTWNEFVILNPNHQLSDTQRFLSITFNTIAQSSLTFCFDLSVHCTNITIWCGRSTRPYFATFLLVKQFAPVLVPSKQGEKTSMLNRHLLRSFLQWSYDAYCTRNSSSSHYSWIFMAIISQASSTDNRVVCVIRESVNQTSFILFLDPSSAVCTDDVVLNIKLL